MADAAAVPGQPPGQLPTTGRLARCLPAIQAFVATHFLLLSFAMAMTVALAWPAPGVAALHVTVLNDVHILQEIGMGIVFFISGLTLDTNELRKVKGNVWSVLFGFASILLISPCLGFAMREVPLQPPEFTIGLVIFCVVPTTLGVGVALVRSCQGNEAIALLLIVATNLLGVFTMPLWLKVMFLNAPFALGTAFVVDIPNLLVKLLITILAPSVIGKLLRDFWPPVLPLCKKYRNSLSIFSTTCLALIIWMTLSGARDILFEAQAGMIAAVIVMGISIHLFYLGFNYLLVCVVFKTSRAEATALVVIASQKSAPVAVTLISYATSVPSQQGLLAIPAIVGQLSQIFIGAAYVPIVLHRLKVACEKEAEQLVSDLAAAVAAGEAEKDSEVAERSGAGSGSGEGGNGGMATGLVSIEFVILEVGKQEAPKSTARMVSQGASCSGVLLQDQLQQLQQAQQQQQQEQQQQQQR